MPLNVVGPAPRELKLIKTNKLAGIFQNNMSKRKSGQNVTISNLEVKTKKWRF